jgi:flagellar basal body-associated protein FliL
VTTEELSTLVQDYHATLDEESDVEKQRKKSRMIRWVGAIVLVLAIVAAVFVLVLHKPAAQSEGVVVVRNPVVTSTPDPTPVKEKPSPAKPAQQP